MGEAREGCVHMFQNRFDLKSKFSCPHFMTTVHSYFFFLGSFAITSAQ